MCVCVRVLFVNYCVLLYGVFDCARLSWCACDLKSGCLFCVLYCVMLYGVFVLCLWCLSVFVFVLVCDLLYDVVGCFCLCYLCACVFVSVCV